MLWGKGVGEGGCRGQQREGLSPGPQGAFPVSGVGADCLAEGKAKHMMPDPFQGLLGRSPFTRQV